MPAKIKITKQQRNLIRGPGGRFVSDDVVKKIVKKKQSNPKATYKELTEQYFKRSKKQAAKYQPRQRDEAGQLISRKAESEIKEASKQLGIPLSQAKALYFESKLKKVITGNVPLHAVSDIADNYNQRQKVKVRVKLPGDKRYRIYNSIERAQKTIEKFKKQYFKQLRKKLGRKNINSDEIPVLPLVEKFKPGEFLPSEIIYNFSNVQQLNQLDDDEAEEIMNEIREGNFRKEKIKEEIKKVKKNRKK